jgi:hypothetical protein
MRVSPTWSVKTSARFAGLKGSEPQVERPEGKQFQLSRIAPLFEVLVRLIIAAVEGPVLRIVTVYNVERPGFNDVMPSVMVIVRKAAGAKVVVTESWLFPWTVSSIPLKRERSTSLTRVPVAVGAMATLTMYSTKVPVGRKKSRNWKLLNVVVPPGPQEASPEAWMQDQVKPVEIPVVKKSETVAVPAGTLLGPLFWTVIE